MVPNYLIEWCSRSPYVPTSSLLEWIFTFESISLDLLDRILRKLGFHNSNIMPFHYARLFSYMKFPSRMPIVSSSGPLHSAAPLHPCSSPASLSSKRGLLHPYLSKLSHSRSAIFVCRYFFRTNAFSSRSTT